MSSIQASLLSQPLPLSETAAANPFVSKAKMPKPAQDTEKVAKDFESVFASMMLKEMRKTLEPGTMFGEDSSDVYGGMFDQFLGQHLADSGGIGLSNMIHSALNRKSADPSIPSDTTKKLN